MCMNKKNWFLFGESTETLSYEVLDLYVMLNELILILIFRATEGSNWILKPTKAKAVRRPKYGLEVLSKENSVANVVNIGKEGHLLISSTEVYSFHDSIIKNAF